MLFRSLASLGENATGELLNINAEEIVAGNDKRIAMGAGPGFLNNIIQIFQIDGQAENIGFLVSLNQYCNDKMGKIAIPHEDVADEYTVSNDGIEPLFIFIVG